MGEGQDGPSVLPEAGALEFATVWKREKAAEGDNPAAP